MVKFNLLKRVPETIEQLIEFAEENKVKSSTAKVLLKAAVEECIYHYDVSKSDSLTTEVVGRIENLHVRLHADQVKVEDLPRGVEDQFNRENTHVVNHISLKKNQECLFIRYEKGGIVYKLNTNTRNDIYMIFAYLGNVIFFLGNEKYADLKYSFFEEDKEGNLFYRPRTN